MANGTEKIAKDWKKRLTEIFSEHPEWKGPQYQRQLLVLLGEGRAPGLRAVQKELPELTRRYEKMQSNGVDEPWSIATLESNPIPPEALPSVLSEYRRNIKGTVLTIRQAKWIGRLYATDLQNDSDGMLQVKRTDRLGSVGVREAYVIAKAEQLCEIAGITDRRPYFEVYDKNLAGLPGESENWSIAFAAAASEAGVLLDDPTKTEGKK